MMQSISSGSIFRRSLLLMGGMLGGSALFVGTMMLVLGLLVERATGPSADSATTSKQDKPSAVSPGTPTTPNKATLPQRGGSTGGST